MCTSSSRDLEVTVLGWIRKGNFVPSNLKFALARECESRNHVRFQIPSITVNDSTRKPPLQPADSLRFLLSSFASGPVSHAVYSRSPSLLVPIRHLPAS